MTDVIQTDVHTASPEPEAQGANVDAHMPPQPVADVTVNPDNPVWAPSWNPDTNEWSPSSEQHGSVSLLDAARNQQPSHGDVITADPMVNDPGDPRTYTDGGGTPDERMNLLDAVRSPRGPQAAPVVTHRHVMETNEVGSVRVRARIVAVVGNTVPSVLLEENRQRDRALIKVLASAALGTSSGGAGTSVPVANPAAGADFVLGPVPAGQTWEVKSLSALFTASAAVATRTPNLVIFDGTGNVYSVALSSAGITASQTDAVSAGEGTPTFYGGAAPNLTATVPLPSMILPAGWSVRSSTGAIQAADQWSAIRASVVELSVLANTVLIYPARQGGVQPSTAFPTGPAVAYPLSNGEGTHEVKSQAAIEAVGVSAAGLVIVGVWEEMADSAPGIGL